MPFPLPQERAAALRLDLAPDRVEEMAQRLHAHCERACDDSGVKSRSRKTVRAYVGALIGRVSAASASGLREDMERVAKHFGDEDLPKHVDNYLGHAVWGANDLLRAAAAQVVPDLGFGSGLVVDDLVFDQQARRTFNRKSGALKSYGMHVGCSDRADEPDDRDLARRRANSDCVRQRTMVAGYLGGKGGVVFGIEAVDVYEPGTRPTRLKDRREPGASGDASAAGLVEELYRHSFMTRTGNRSPVLSAVFDERGWSRLRAQLAAAGVDYVVALANDAGARFRWPGKHEGSVDTGECARRLQRQLQRRPDSEIAHLAVTGLVGEDSRPVPETIVRERATSPGSRPILWVVGSGGEDLPVDDLTRMVASARAAAATLDRRLLEQLHAEAWLQTNGNSWRRHLALVATAHAFITGERHRG